MKWNNLMFLAAALLVSVNYLCVCVYVNNYMRLLSFNTKSIRTATNHQNFINKMQYKIVFAYKSVQIQSWGINTRNRVITFLLHYYCSNAIYHLVALVLLIILDGQQIYPTTEYLAQYSVKLFMTKIKFRFY
jgi:hypothetical protein